MGSSPISGKSGGLWLRGWNLSEFNGLLLPRVHKSSSQAHSFGPASSTHFSRTGKEL